MARLEKGEKFVTGLRKEFLGSTFESAKIVRLEGSYITTGSNASRDLLEEVPAI